MLFLEPSEIEMVKVLHSKKVPVQVVEMNATKEQVEFFLDTSDTIVSPP